MDVEDVSARVIPARCQANLAAFDQLIEAGIAVRLKDAFESGKMGLGVDAFAVRRVRE